MKFKSFDNWFNSKFTLFISPWNMATPHSWKELWRPFLEVTPKSLKPIEELIFSSVLKEIGTQEDEMIVMRGLKLFSHYCNDPDLFEYLLSYEQHDLTFDLLFNSVVSSGSILDDERDPGIRHNALLVLCSFCSHRQFFYWIKDRPQETIGSFFQLTELALQRLEDPSIQVSELAIEFLTRWITAGSLKQPDEYNLWKVEVLDKLELGEKLFKIFEEARLTSTQIALTNLVIELTCPLEQSSNQENTLKDPFAPKLTEVRNYYRGRMFVHYYQLAESTLFYINSYDRILRYRVVELLESLTSHYYHFLLLPKQINFESMESEIIELNFIRIVEEMIWLANTGSSKLFQIVGLYAQCSSALKFQYASSQKLSLNRFYIPSLFIVLSKLFDISTCDNGTKLEPLSNSRRTGRDIILVTTMLVDSTTKLLNELGILFINSFDTSLWDDSLLLQNTGETFENLKDVIGEKRLDILDILLSIIEHPDLKTGTSLVVSCTKAIHILLEKDVTNSKLQYTISYYNSIDDIKYSNELDLVYIILRIIGSEKTPVSALTELYKLFSFILSLILREDGTWKDSILENIKELTQLQLYHPTWERNDATVHFIESLFYFKKADLSQIIQLGLLDLILQGLEIKNRYVQASSLSVLSNISIHPNISVELINESFNKSNLPKDNEKSFMSYIWSSVGNEENIFRRELLELIHNWFSEKKWRESTILYCSDNNNLEMCRYENNIIHISYT